MSQYYQYVYLEITVLCSQHGSNYFLLVQIRHIPKGNDAQLMVQEVYFQCCYSMKNSEYDQEIPQS